MGEHDNTATIYALVDSRYPDSYRYVGKTIKSMGHRLYAHMYRLNIDKNLYKTHWIRKVIAEGADVNVVALEVCCADEQDIREMFWIAKCRDLGHRLTNMTDGGEGGFNPCAEVRAKISAANKGRRMAPHLVELARIRGKGYVGEKNPNFGNRWSDAQKEHLRKIKTGVPLSDAHKVKLSEAGKGKNSGERNGSGKLSTEQVVEVYKRIKVDGENRRDVALQFGIHQMTTYKITGGTKWKHLNLKERFETNHAPG